MMILAINGSPRREKSITWKITSAFLQGMQTEDSGDAVTALQVYDFKVEPCRADFACWFRTPGKCIIDDDVAGVYEKVRESDLVLWSVPLYVFGFPAPVKALFDRILPWVKPEIAGDSFGLPSHPGLGEDGSKHLLFMSGALPGVEDNFGPAVRQFRRIFGKNAACITCAESSLLIYRKSEEIQEMAKDYLSLAKTAGEEYRREGRIHSDTIASLNALMMPKDDYIRFTNGRI